MNRVDDTRTRANVRDSDATLWLGDYHSPGGRTTLDACRLQGKPFMICYPVTTRSSQVVAWIREHTSAVLNLAGEPGIDVARDR